MRNRVWLSVAFFNYLQTPMPEPRVAGRPEDYEAAVPALFEVLEACRPDYLIVWGPACGNICRASVGNGRTRSWWMNGPI